MQRLRRISSWRSPTPSPEANSTVKPLVARQLGGLSLPTLPRATPSRPLRPLRPKAPDAPRILDFDIETLAAGFADPDWVPQKIMCVAWSWLDEEEVQTSICGPMGFFDPQLRREMLRPFLSDLDHAERVTGHNILRFDLPVLNSECLRLGLRPLRPIEVQDTIRIKRTKGFKKGQDNLGRLLQTYQQKEAMDWQAWEEAYEESGWPQIQSRAKTDVIQHKEIRKAMEERGWLKPVTTWRP